MRDYVVKYDDLCRVTKEMFMGLGYSDLQASTVTECLVEADLRHKHSHGVAAMMTYVSHLKAGNLHLTLPNRRRFLKRRSPSSSTAIRAWATA